MADVFGFDADGIRKLTEVVRRVMQAEFGKGGKRQRWPVPTPSSGSRWIHFRVIDMASAVTANCYVLGSSDGNNLGETVQVTDATDEGCFFTDETEYELADRNGYAVWMKAIVDESTLATEWRWEVPSLCCPPAS